MVAGAAWIVGDAVWIPTQANAVTPWQPSLSASSSSSSSAFDLTAVRQSQLFGRYQISHSSVPVVQNAPQTRLQLRLVGVVASRDVQQGLAVIANRGKQATYGVNENIAGTRAMLKAVLADRVILDNAGQDETLMLDGTDYHQLDAGDTAARASDGDAVEMNTDAQTARLEHLRAELATNPQKIFDYVRLSQVKEGEQLVGYRVSPGQDEALFESLGLRNGDIATHVNGEDLSNPTAMNTLIAEMAEWTELRLTVERDGQSHDIYIEF